MKNQKLNALVALLLCFVMFLSSCDAGFVKDFFGDSNNNGAGDSLVNEQENGTGENSGSDKEGHGGNSTPGNESDKGDEPEPEEKDEYSTMWAYSTDRNGVVVRDLTIHTGKGGKTVTVIQLSDLHFNYCNERDFEEANPAVMSTYENRTWLKNGKSLPNALKCLEYADNADQLVITGDILDYLSYGALEMAKENIFEPYPDVMVALGDHEVERKVQGKVDDNSTLESRYEILEEYWPHDLFYSSKVLEDKVMLIQMDNSSTEGFLDCQIEPFKRDMKLARENGYKVLLFFHTHLRTNNPKYRNAKALLVGDNNGASANMQETGVGKSRSAASAVIYDLIVNNADIIGGCFAGHMHNDYYTEIIAKNADGTAAVIPQYSLLGTPYSKGNVLRITIE